MPRHAERERMCATTSSCDCELYRTDRKHRTSEDNLF